jgi:hypothetical protein
MNITWSLLAYLIWFGVMTLALIGTLVAGVRRRGGWVNGIKLLLGGLLMFGFVSGIVGIQEAANYARSLAFAISMALGLTGAVLFYFGSKGIWSRR